METQETRLPSTRRLWESPLPSLLAQVKDITLDRMHRRLDEEGFDGLRYKHGCVFRFVDEEGSRLTDLADRSGLTKQGIGEAVSELERLGYVERVAAPDDRRAKIIRLTERGRAGQAAAARILGEIEYGWARRFGADQVAALRATLEQIAGARE
jgi:DNA-binding MarR family transcriptional regulator